MNVLIHAFSRLERPGLYVWRVSKNDHTIEGIPIMPIEDDRDSGWSTFQITLDTQLGGTVYVKLVGRDAAGNGVQWEKDVHNRELKRLPDTTFPEKIWIFHETRRVLTVDPASASPVQRLTIHLVTLNRYRDGQLYVWDATGRNERYWPTGQIDNYGPVFELELTINRRQFFYFKFVKGDKDNEGNRTEFEPDLANRVYVANDGDEIWVHSDADIVRRTMPLMRQLLIHLHSKSISADFPQIHLWQPGSGFALDLMPEPDGDGWYTYRRTVYTDIDYKFKVHYTRPGGDWWEDDRAVRVLRLSGDKECWTLEGDNVLFGSKPDRDLAVTVRIAAQPSGNALAESMLARVGVQYAKDWAETDLAVSDQGDVTFYTYRGLSMKLDYVEPESSTLISRHLFETPNEGDAWIGYSVLTKPAILRSAPPADLFTDPPFRIKRPGVWQENGVLYFALHVLDTSRARLVGEWTNEPIDMKLTNDGTFFWVSVPINDVVNGYPAGNGDYHGAKYKFLLNDDTLIHDPAAHWVEGSGPCYFSLLFNPDRYPWRSDSWKRPGLEYLIIYQIHPARFSGRYPALSPLLQVAREIDEQAGYLRELGVTAIQLLPVNEVSSPTYGWGYDPSFFYAIEHNYGGPEALQELADTCHAHGMALILDVVFNHTGNTDNILYSTAHDTFIDGDTSWGPLINFDNPICRFFFEQNLQYLAETFRIDGFRFDHTDTIINGHRQTNQVNVAGSGGGWEFLNGLRDALKRVDSRCFLIAEELPNDWYLTSSGAMDSQWCDAFHDRMIDVCRKKENLRAFADAMAVTNHHNNNWYSATNYAESHDEVGNTDDRIAKCAAYGSGLRLAKVSLAAVLLSRGLPHIFMGGEAGETQQFAKDHLDVLPLVHYQTDPNRQQVIAWFRVLCGLRLNDQRIKGPAPIAVHYVEDLVMTFSRGGAKEFFVVLNFGGWAGWKSLASLGLPDGTYMELWNSTWPAFAIAGEWENEHTNGGRHARLSRNSSLQIPDFGVVILLKT